MNKNKEYIVIIIFLIGIFLRLYNFRSRIVFGPEQGMSLITTAQMIDEKISLLGEKYIQRQDSNSHFLFHSPVFNYFLAPVVLLSKFDPVKITYFFAVLNLVAIFLSYLVFKYFFGREVAIFSSIFLIFDPTMVYHSTFIWIINPLPVLGTLFILFLSTYLYKNHLNLSIFLVGLISGLSFGIQVMAFPLFVVTIFMLVINKSKLSHFMLLVLGFCAANLPTILFDFKHDFYNLRIYLQLFSDLVSHRVSGNMAYYQFFYLWPFFALIVGIIMTLINKFSKPIVLVLIFIYIFICITSPKINLRRAVDARDGISVDTALDIAKAINSDNPPQKFNIVTVLDFDTQSHPLRYLSSYLYGRKPQSTENYQDVDALYVFAESDYQISRPLVWELKIFMPYKVTLLKKYSPKYNLYKIVKQ